MTFLRLSEAASHGPAPPVAPAVPQGSQEGAGSPTFDCVKWLAICCSAWMSLSPWNELLVYLCAQARPQLPLPSSSAQNTAHSTAQHTARSSRRSLMRRNGRNRKKCSILSSELGAVFEPRYCYLCALICHLSRVPHTLNTLQNRWSPYIYIYIYTYTPLCVCVWLSVCVCNRMPNRVSAA